MPTTGGVMAMVLLWVGILLLAGGLIRRRRRGAVVGRDGFDRLESRLALAGAVAAGLGLVLATAAAG